MSADPVIAQDGSMRRKQCNFMEAPGFKYLAVNKLAEGDEERQSSEDPRGYEIRL